MHINAAFDANRLPYTLQRRTNLHGNYLGLLSAEGVFLARGLVRDNNGAGNHHWFAYDGWRGVLFWRDDEVIGVEEDDKASREDAKKVFTAWGCRDIRGVYELMRWSR